MTTKYGNAIAVYSVCWQQLIRHCLRKSSRARHPKQIMMMETAQPSHVRSGRARRRPGEETDRGDFRNFRNFQHFRNLLRFGCKRACAEWALNGARPAKLMRRPPPCSQARAVIQGSDSSNQDNFSLFTDLPDHVSYLKIIKTAFSPSSYSSATTSRHNSPGRTSGSAASVSQTNS